MAVPKKKNPVGRPLAFKSVEELEQKIEEYFTFCDNRIQQIYSAKQDAVIEVINPEPYTMSGLAYHIGIDRDTILNYSKKEEYFGTIKRARDKVQADVERRMNDKNTFTPGLIFNAKNNFGWKDRTETDITSQGDKLPGIQVYLPEKLKDDSNDT